MRLPAIVPLLLVGILLGPGLLGVVKPAAFGDGLRVVVGLAVAVILFEGGLSLKPGTLRSPAGGTAIRNLVTIGALITWGLSAVAAWLILDMSWPLALLFGSLVTVTGPTVILPILRIVRPRERLANVLRGEAIVIDPIGALYAVLVLEFLLAHEAGSGGDWEVVQNFGLRILVGGVAGAVSALVLYLLLRRRDILAPDLKNLATLAVAIGVYALCETVSSESGVLAVTVGGIILAALHPPGLEEIEEFKGQMTLLMVSIVFILLAAQVEIHGLFALGWSGVLLITLLILVVRPVTVFVSCIRTGLTLREKLFLSWLAPRGIVAAAVSSLFALILEARGLEGGPELRNMTFAVIAGTVLLQGPTARPLGRLLGVLERDPHGFLIIGANRVARGFASALMRAKLRVLLIDTNSALVRYASRQGLPSRHGNAFDALVMEELNLGGIGNVLSLTPNDSINRLASRIWGQEFGPDHVHALRTEESPEEASDFEGYVGTEELLFGTVERRLRSKWALGLFPIESEVDAGVAAAAIDPKALPLAVVFPDGRLRWIHDSGDNVPEATRLLALAPDLHDEAA